MKIGNIMRHKKWLVGAGVAIAAIGGGGAAFAAWTVTGSGSGGAAGATVQNLVVTAVIPSNPAAASLWPGGPPGWVYLSIQNPNPFAVNVTGIQWGTPSSTNTTSCPSANISVDNNAPTTLSVAVAANTTSGAVQINGVLDLSHNAPNGCQGVGFIVPVTVSATQQ